MIRYTYKSSSRTCRNKYPIIRPENLPEKEIKNSQPKWTSSRHPGGLHGRETQVKRRCHVIRSETQEIETRAVEWIYWWKTPTLFCCRLKGTVSRDFGPQVFLHESVSPKALSIPLGPFPFFRKFAEIFWQLKVHHLCRWHRWQRKNIFYQKSFSFLVWTPWALELTYR